MHRNLERDGFTLVSRALSGGELAEVTSAVSMIDMEGRGGARGLLDVAAVQELAMHSAVREVAEAVLGPECFAVRALLFDKRADANWRVMWHQDVTIAVRERHEAPGYGPWSVKHGVPHVQAPASLLESMVAIRVHLDPCGPENGPVRVLPGTHAMGRLSPEAIDRLCHRAASVECIVPLGGLLVMRPLLLHASSPARVPGQRRVLHLEFAASALPEPLEWHDRCAPGLMAGAA